MSHFELKIHWKENFNNLSKLCFFFPWTLSTLWLQQSNIYTKQLLPGTVAISLPISMSYVYVRISPYRLAALFVLFFYDMSAESFRASCASQMQRKRPFAFYSVLPFSIFPIFFSVWVKRNSKKEKNTTNKYTTKKETIGFLFLCFWPYFLCISSNNFYVIRPMDSIWWSWVLSFLLPQFISVLPPASAGFTIQSWQPDWSQIQSHKRSCLTDIECCKWAVIGIPHFLYPPVLCKHK